ncbi:MAG: hypothetical protein XE00_0352 [Desulfofundulus kuznetsovii]|nr:MAG: hypothetical protein XD84_0785 [Desulfotomaculum sp. 46_80]KUK85001.1 MAG: hypothetical protein XE00_0352 [Desulfofundulus kuznetsovii]
MPLKRCHQEDENGIIKEGQCLKCDFEPSFKERENPRVSEENV